jgi:hypothetical protein
MAVALLAAAVAGAAVLALRRSASPPRSAALRVSLTQLTTDPGVEAQPSLSPDGKSLV